MSSFVARELFPKPVEGGSVLAMDILAKKFREQTLEEAANPNASQIKFVSKLPYCFSKKQNGARHVCFRVSAIIFIIIYHHICNFFPDLYTMF